MTLPFSVWALLALSMAAGLVAGVFLTFSDFVMRSLRATQPAGGAEAMQIINREVYRSLFMALLMGMVPVAAAVAGYAVLFMDGPVRTWLLAAGLLYVIGVFGVTAAGNVPMNKRLAAMPQAGAEAQAYWPTYVRGWVRWNHIRWVTALGASISYAVSAVLVAGGA